MTKLQIIIYIFVLYIIVFGVSSFVEFYKKVLRKNKTKKIENVFVGLFFSILSVALLSGLGILKPILQIVGAPVFTDYLLYIVMIYCAQKQTNMKIVKALMKSCIKTLLLNSGMSISQIDEILQKSKKIYN